MKFSNVLLGKRAERPISFEFRGIEHKTATRPLDGMEEGLALARATAYAQEQKALEAKPGTPLFDLGYMANVVALAYVDIDSPEDARVSYFDSVAQVLSLDGELLQYLHARQETWQQECSPTKATMPAGELINTLVRIVEREDDLFFAAMRPGLQLSCLRITAKLLLNSPEGRSRLSSLFDPTFSNGSSAAKTNPLAPPS